MSKKPTLREIGDDLLALHALLEEVGGDVTDEQAEAAIDQWLEETRGNLATKLDGYITLIQEAHNRVRIRQEEASRLQDLAYLDQAIVDRLRDRLCAFMQDHHPEEIQTNHHRLRLVEVGGKLAMEVTGEIPPEYYRPVTRNQLDTERIRRELEAGKELTFARLLPRGHRIAIK